MICSIQYIPTADRKQGLPKGFCRIRPTAIKDIISEEDYLESMDRLNLILEDSRAMDDTEVFDPGVICALACLCCGGFCYLNERAKKARNHMPTAVSRENEMIWAKVGLRLELSVFAVTSETPQRNLGPDMPIRRNNYYQHCLNVYRQGVSNDNVSTSEGELRDMSGHSKTGFQETRSLLNDREIEMR